MASAYKKGLNRLDKVINIDVVLAVIYPSIWYIVFLNRFFAEQMAVSPSNMQTFGGDTIS